MNNLCCLVHPFVWCYKCQMILCWECWSRIYGDIFRSSDDNCEPSIPGDMPSGYWFHSNFSPNCWLKGNDIDVNESGRTK